MVRSAATPRVSNHEAHAGTCLDSGTHIELNVTKRASSQSPARKRADVLLVERGLFESRARAQAAIEAGLVTANDKQVTKPSEGIATDAVLHAQPAHPFVSRGGVKLAGALERYAIEVEGHVCLDVGASTGGFTEVLLANGASLVFSIDVGREQLHPSLRGHPRVVSMEETDIRDFEGKRLPVRPDVVVIDVSFISLKAVLPVALSLAASPMHLLALIKPQFEAPRKHSKRGIIRNATVHQEICDDIAAFVASQGCTGIEVFPSSITGGDGNIEFFVGARRG
jgi:23S rRNA (cytidine1920-2'-O)/16S rRNA (cytidine1409-2'-O)-methyltransferase